ncbi:MAG: hypothetical protein KF744_03105 [Taibaiella sp.]|nr:hypothetical protein [Taibaiella sp.]
MNQNIARIKAGLETMMAPQPQLVSGVVVAGSVNTTTNTCDVSLLSGVFVKDVMLSAVSESADGVLCFPKDGTSVVIGTVYGGGQWVLLNASELETFRIGLGNVSLEITDSGLSLQNGSASVNVSELIKIATAAESLHSILTDLVNAIAAITVGTPSGTSTVPVNIASITALLPRINNLLST